MEEATEKAPNLGYLIEKIKKDNQLKARLLPEKTDNKLTVVLELDEVLVYTFTPDEEGYLLAPYRKHDFEFDLMEYHAPLNIYMRKNFNNFVNFLTEEC